MGLRIRANGRAYRLMTVAIALCLTCAALFGERWRINIGAQSFHIWHPQTRDDFRLIFWLYICVDTVLPNMILAWMEGDLPNESEESIAPDPPRPQEGSPGKE